MATEKRLIDANAIKYYEHTECGGHGMYYLVRIVNKESIDRMPTVDAVEVVHGSWWDTDYMIPTVVCSVCGEWFVQNIRPNTATIESTTSARSAVQRWTEKGKTMTFKQFVQWCNERACDGCWGFLTAMQCIEVMRDVKSQPFWKREKYWKHHYMHSTVIEMVEKTNQLIQERFCKDNA